MFFNHIFVCLEGKYNRKMIRYAAGSRAAATSKMEITKSFILDVAAALDPPLR